MACPLGQGRLSQCEHFADKGGEGKFFAILCGRLLWTVKAKLGHNYNQQAKDTLF